MVQILGEATEWDSFMMFHRPWVMITSSTAQSIKTGKSPCAIKRSSRHDWNIRSRFPIRKSGNIFRKRKIILISTSWNYQKILKTRKMPLTFLRRGFVQVYSEGVNRAAGTDLTVFVQRDWRVVEVTRPILMDHWHVRRLYDDHQTPIFMFSTSRR